MIWISTLCLLFIAAWLFFNAVNERRWVQAHSHDETVASDKGFLPSLSALTGTGALDSDGKVSIDQENTPFARAVAKVKDKTSVYGEKFFESKAAAARIDDPAQRPRSASEENTLFGRAVARVAEKAERMDQKLDAKIKQSSRHSHADSPASGEEETLFARTTNKVTRKSDEIGQKIAHRAKNIAQGYGDGHSASNEGGMFSKVVGGVSDGINKIDSRISRSRRQGNNTEDLMSRVAAKVGKKVNELDEKFVSASKTVASKLDKSASVGKASDSSDKSDNS